MKALQRVLGRRVVDWQMDVLQPLFSRIVMVSNDPQLGFSVGLPIVNDRTPGLGPLAGIEAALGALADYDDVVFVACDMPFIEPRLVRLIRDYQPGSDAAVPLTARGAEPLLARWSTHAVGAVTDQLLTGDTRVTSALARLNVAWISEGELREHDPEMRSFASLNARAEARQAARPEPATTEGAQLSGESSRWR